MLVVWQERLNLFVTNLIAFRLFQIAADTWKQRYFIEFSMLEKSSGQTYKSKNIKEKRNSC